MRFSVPSSICRRQLLHSVVPNWIPGRRQRFEHCLPGRERRVVVLGLQSKGAGHAGTAHVDDSHSHSGNGSQERRRRRTRPARFQMARHMMTDRQFERLKIVAQLARERADPPGTPSIQLCSRRRVERRDRRANRGNRGSAPARPSVRCSDCPSFANQIGEHARIAPGVIPRGFDVALGEGLHAAACLLRRHHIRERRCAPALAAQLPQSSDHDSSQKYRRIRQLAGCPRSAFSVPTRCDPVGSSPFAALAAESFAAQRGQPPPPRDAEEFLHEPAR